MTMIQERYVSFEIAKLLKEKGFDEPCRLFYKDPQAGLYEFINAPKAYKDNPNNPCFLAPSLYMAMEWLRVEKYIIIFILPTKDEIGNFAYCYDIATWSEKESVYEMNHLSAYFYTYEEAVKSAIKYSLENLI